MLDTIRMSPDTTDFTPIYNGVEAKKPDVLIAGLSHVGVQPTVQWANQQVPIPIYGVVSQATSTTFWNDTNGATDGVVLQNMAVESVATTPKTVPFAQSYIKRFGISPAYPGYGTYDAVYYVADAVRRAGSDDPDKLVDALEKTDWTGTVGQIRFYGKDESHAHGMVYGRDAVSGLFVQWQNGKMVAVWPKSVAGGNALKFPAFIRASAN